MAGDTVTEEATGLEEPALTDAPPAADVAVTPDIGGISGAGVKILALWVPTPTRRRLIDIDAEIVEDVNDGPDLILVSTRGPAARRSSVADLAQRAPVVVVCPPGDEKIAAEYVVHGAVTVVAEGAEATALRVLDGGSSAHLVEAFAGEVDRTWSGSGSLTVDPVTGLATSSSFELSLAEMGKDGVMPRLGLVRLGIDDVHRVIGPAATSVLKRRLAVAIAESAVFRGAEVFDLGATLAFVAESMSASEASAFGNDIVGLGHLFAPNGDPLEIAVGSAGPESASDIPALRLLAERALEMAGAGTERVVDAEAMSQHSASAVELAAAMAVAAAVDGNGGKPQHSERIADYVTEIARFLQLEPLEIAAIGLAGRLHDIGKSSFGPAAFDEQSDMFETARLEHPERGERYVLPSCGPQVASIVRSHHERWDGSGFPDGLAGNDVPLGARILAVAHRYDDLVGAGASGAAVESSLRDEAGVILDPDLVEAAIALFGHG